MMRMYCAQRQAIAANYIQNLHTEDDHISSDMLNNRMVQATCECTSRTACVCCYRRCKCLTHTSLSYHLNKYLLLLAAFALSFSVIKVN